ncbi:MAG: 23S rRNA (adenine(2503)-C(2))-methyltransferase RlmN [Verrucomicrobiota bacterium]|nr:23S rRNA (adenine(2503)-C(2))-methyltransferase RlmN [Verrucomicrobiota bacterium]
MQDIKSITQTELEQILSEVGIPKYRSGQVLDWIYKKRIKTWGQMTNLPQELREKLAKSHSMQMIELVEKQGSADTTQKFLWRLDDGQLIESVLIPASPALYGDTADRRTLCVSSQVGCAYGCHFCASGLNGWKRNLLPNEIVEQILRAEEISGEKVNNIVFMGMGEPLANYDNLIRAVEIINAPWGIGIGARKITISTSGLVPQIKKLAKEPWQIRLAISLHGATDEVRSQIMPVNQKYPLEDLIRACQEFQKAKKQFISFEYILIEGVNDSQQDADNLGKLSNRLKAKVNLIPYNTVDGLHWKRPSEAQQESFLARLEKVGVPATLRREKGHDIDAACGQLRLRTEREGQLGLSS